MPRKRYETEQILAVLRQVEVLVANGRLTPQACREAGIGERACRHLYRPSRTPVAGRRNFCPSCGKRAAWRWSKRRRAGNNRI